MLLSGAEIAALEFGPYNLGLFIRLNISPPLRCWLGLGPIAIGVNALDPSGATYSGFGQLLNVPAMQQLINGAADRAEIGLSGADARILELATFADTVQGKACDIGFALMGTDWQLLAGIHWVRRYFADCLTMVVTPAASPEEQTVKTATLSIGSQMTGRRRAGLSYFNNQDQGARSYPSLPLDRFCERVYSMLGQKTWPKY